MPQRKTRPRRTSRARRSLLLLLIGAIVIGALFYRAAHRPLSPNVRERAAPRRTSTPPALPVQPSQTASAQPERAATPLASNQPVPAASPRISASGEHRLALIIDDCGQWLQTERGFIALPIALSMSVMPKERYTQTIAQEARAAGKGVMLHVPMEPLGTMDPGPGKITTAMSDSAVVAQLQDDLDRVPLAKGVNNHEGSKATADERVMKDVVSVLAARGLFFIDSRTNADSVAARVAGAAGVPTGSRDVFLDNEDSVEAIKHQIRQAAAIALTSGQAIAIGHPREATLEAIRSLIPELEAQGISFTDAANLVR